MKNEKEIEFNEKLKKVRSLAELDALIKEADEQDLSLISKRGTRNSGRRPIIPNNEVGGRLFYLYDDGQNSGSSKFERFYYIAEFVSNNSYRRV